MGHLKNSVSNEILATVQHEKIQKMQRVVETWHHEMKTLLRKLSECRVVATGQHVHLNVIDERNSEMAFVH